MFSAGVHEADGGRKDTVANVEATGEFVYNMATWAQKDQMNETAWIIDRGVDEMAATGLEPLPSRLVRPPRVKGSPVHFECRLHQVVTLPGRQSLERAPRRDRAGGGRSHRRRGADRGRPGRRPKIRPIARLGYKDYVCVEADVPDGQEANARRQSAGEFMMAPALLLVMTVAAPCESLQTLALPETTILSATLVPEGPFTPPSAADDRRSPFRCRPRAGWWAA